MMKSDVPAEHQPVAAGKLRANPRHASILGPQQKGGHVTRYQVPAPGHYTLLQGWSWTTASCVIFLSLAVAFRLWHQGCLDPTVLATTDSMWTSTLLSTFVLSACTAAQGPNWGWHPGPWHGWNNNSAHVVDLTGPGWTLTSENGTIIVPASVPSQQYIDLYNAGVIPDPLFGENNTGLGWVRDQNWTYSRTLSQLNDGPHGGTESTFLVFEGLDTFTTITFCGIQIAYTENQWRQYTFDISDALRSCSGNPDLLLNFGAAVNITNDLSKSPYSDGNVNFGTTCNGNAGNELNCKAYARKEQNDFGWDWSPSLVPAGPWKPIYAVQFAPNTAYVNNVAIDIYRKGQMNNIPPDQSQPWIFNASIDFTGTIPQESGLRLTLKNTCGNQIVQQELDGVYSSDATITGSTTIDPASVRQWWPNGLGKQPLYSATIDILGPRGDVVASANRRVGFRTIVLNLGNVTDAQLAAGVAPGSNWHFEINGHEFFVKGSNFIPPDVFWPRVDAAKIMQLFTLAKDANMNLLRVWSSGAYLADWIYDMADQMGLLLWSEFEFSDAPYPANDHYFAEYEAEAYYNVRRVNHHPSLALWAGGNELEAIMLNYFFNSDIFYEYQTIFEELLVKCVFANTRSISYIPSSTYNGYLSLDFDSVHPMTGRYKNTSGPGYYYADTDAYVYDAPQLFNYSAFPVGRFADEFGFLSIPSIQSWEQEAPAEDLYYPSDTIINHNRHYEFGSDVTDLRNQSLGGIADMTKAVEYYLPSPNLQDSRANFSAWCYSTQVVHADAMVHQIAFYRRGSGMPERQLGSLYWMLNDVWNAPTWASIEANGRQKVLHYAAKDIYKSAIVYAFYDLNTTDLEVWVTSDLWNSVSGTLSYQWVDFSGQSLTAAAPYSDSGLYLAPNGSQPFTVGAINTTRVLRYPSLSSSSIYPGLNLHDAILFLSLSTTNGTHNHTSVFHPTPLRDVSDLPDPGLTLAHSGNIFTVTATRAVAAWVWLEVDTTDVSGYWSDNGFWLRKGESRSVGFTIWDDASNGTWVQSVSVRSVWDNTRE